MSIEQLIDKAIDKYFPKKYDCAYSKQEQCGGKVAIEGWICGECHSQYGDTP